MQVLVEPGKYVVAVSGGLDSVVLLDILSKTADLELVVAHFDHGIRADSSLDRQLVETLSQKYELPFEYLEVQLGEGTSEETARDARYSYLQQIRKKHQADGLITAHHQDDALETATFNLLRGTKRKGFSSLQSTDNVIRPLLNHSKDDIRGYANKNKLQWREDLTNNDERYARNWIRHRLMPKLKPTQKADLTRRYRRSVDINKEADQILEQQLDVLTTASGLHRQQFIQLPFIVSAEVLVLWLRNQGIEVTDRRLVDQLVVGIKTLPAGKKLSVNKKHHLSLSQNDIQLK